MSLDPKHITVSELLSGRIFNIPEYQRAYSWKKEQRSDLFSDIMEAYNSETQHFMATIVALKIEDYRIEADKFEKLDIVDGQQRITTLIILLKSLERALEEGADKELRYKEEIASLLVKRNDTRATGV